MEKQKTALMCFLEELEKVNDVEGVANLIEQALEMEKQQIKHAHLNGKFWQSNSEQYYSETYKQNNDGNI
jgi:uncharacterized protein (DUF1697 family)